ncbi:MAG TPA: AMP-binding protein [Bryobacteraceae bacterium]|nr:AMP-binding protein [Bryobacteraceae bacterium]
MPEFAMRVYNAFPLARPLLASARGYVLNHWRYGADVDERTSAALERETWTADKWRGWQEDQLARTLHHASRNVPYYREMWAKRRHRGDQSSPEVLQNWPILEKDDIRRNPYAFVADNRRTAMRAETTSGTTGQPIKLWFSKETTRSWYSLCEARFRLWNGVSRADRWASLGAQLVAPASQKTPPFWVWNRGLNQLYMSAYHVSAVTVRHYLAALAEHSVSYLWGHSSALETIAREVLRSRLETPRLRVVLSSSEPFTRKQRKLLETAFGCPARETYGMTEMAAAASECGHGNMHAWPEVGWLELADATTNTNGTVSGDLVSTGFLNSEMPLIRYRIGDRASFQSAATCACGRTLPLLQDIEGRISDTLLTADGRRLSPSAMEIVFDTDIAVHEAQIVQEALDRVRIRYVPAEGFSAAMAERLRERVQSRMGAVRITLERTDAIPRGANAKFRAVVCNVAQPVSAGESGDTIDLHSIQAGLRPDVPA